MKDLNEKNGKRIQICIMPNMALIGNQKISFGSHFRGAKRIRKEEEKEKKKKGREEEFKEDQRYGIMCTFGLW